MVAQALLFTNRTQFLSARRDCRPHRHHVVPDMADTNESHQQALRIALQHHQAGEVAKAEEVYRQVLADDPKNGEALHWLGLLAHQCGKHDLALGLMGKALLYKSAVSSYHHNYAEVWLAVGETEQAIESFQRAIALRPDSAHSHASLAMALMRMGRLGEAIDSFRPAIELGLNHPQVHHHFGIALLQTQQYAEAEVALRRTLTIDPNMHEACHHLGEALGRQNKLDAAAEMFETAIKIKSDFSRPYHGLGVVYGLRGELDEAIDSFRKAIELSPEYSDAYQGLAAVRHRTNRIEEARENYRKAIELRPTYLQARFGLGMAAELAGDTSESIRQYEEILRQRPDFVDLEYHIAALSGERVPAASPDAYIVRVFDGYAEKFDDHLIKTLKYRGPELLVGAVLKVKPGDDLDIVDLGCGTGLCGRLLRPLARNLVGIDLSSSMIEKARDREVYDDLQVSELTLALLARPGEFDLATACDVLIYFGDLSPIFAAAAVALRPKALFAFTVEAGAEGDFALHKTRRYVHSEDYLQRVAKEHGFVVVRLEHRVLRKERGEDVGGIVAVFRFETTPSLDDEA